MGHGAHAGQAPGRRRRGLTFSTARALAPAAALVAALALCTPLAAQAPTRPYREWRTLQTAHFSFHYPRDFEAWTQLTARHIEAVDSAVSALVGFSPSQRIDVVIDDPYGQSNGSALPFLRAPVLTFWPVPPSPRSQVGNWRSWSEMLSVHEFGHLAHLMRPSRNPWTSWVWKLAPVELGPLAAGLPRWVTEGYATFIEGRVTGSGRPNSAWRAAILRQWALEGHLPTYDQMSSWNAYNGGSFAYLAGSAFLEWLAQQQGDSSLVHVWRRATARAPRTFDQAFVGVYGDSPRLLYERFTAALMTQASDAQRAMDAAGRVDGTLDQHLDWGTGDPALSPDGKALAIVLRSAIAPPRTVIWSTAPPLPDSAAQARTSRELARDPQDVPARQFYPRPRTVRFTLPAVDGRAFESPRFLPGGTRLLVTRSTRQADGSDRPDLYEWIPASGRVRRVTVGAAVQDPDPSPDGQWALATRCAGGGCGVVRIALSSGAATVLLAGTPERSYYRPRYSPDGAAFVVSVHDGSRWRLATASADGSALTFVDPNDDANRFDAVFRPDGRSLVFAGDASGGVDLYELALGTGRERQLTRVTGAAVAPTVDAQTGVIWFLSLHARGWDLRRLPGDTAVGGSLALTGRFWPAAPPRPPARDTLAVNPVRGPTPYGLGPRHTRYLPGITYGPDGLSTSAWLTNVDVIGRLTTTAGVAYGARSQWNGATGAAALRMSRVEVDAGAHWARQLPSHGSVPGAAGPIHDATRTGGLLALAYDYFDDQFGWRARLGAGREAVTPAPGTPTLPRTLGFAEWSGRLQQSRGTQALVEQLAVHADAGTTGGTAFRRAVVRAAAGVTGIGLFPLAGSFTWGRVSSNGVGFEQFNAGGAPSPLVDSSLTAARLAIAALPSQAISTPLHATGSTIYNYRISAPMGILAPYYEAVRITGNAGSPAPWHRVAGVEIHAQATSLSALYLPGVSITFGLARSFDAPFANRTSLYSSVRILP